MSTQNPFGSVSEDRLVDEVAADNGDPIFTKAELNSMSNTMVRRLAANAETDLINGKSPRMLIECYFTCQRDLSEFCEG